MRGRGVLEGPFRLPDCIVRKLQELAPPAAHTEVDTRPTRDATDAAPAELEPDDAAPPAERTITVTSSVLDGPDGPDAHRQIAAESANGDVDAAPCDTAQPSHYWTWRLLAAGFSPAECAAIRGLDGNVVFDHALRAAEEGRTCDAGWFLTADKITALDRVIGASQPERIRPLLAKLPRGMRYEEVQYYLKARPS